MVMQALQLAGRIIMENGGETYRAEETVTRMGRAFGLNHVESFAIPSGVFVSYEKEDGTHETAVLRVRRQGTNLTRVDEVNRISRRAEAGEINVQQALDALHAIEKQPGYPTWMLLAAAAVSSGGWAVMFGGGLVDSLVAFFTAGLVQWLNGELARRRLHGPVATLMGSFLATLMPQLFCFLTHLGTVDACVAGALMPLLPGLAMTNAVQDTLRGDIVSSVAHGMNAILTATLIAGGALFATTLFQMITGGAL